MATHFIVVGLLCLCGLSLSYDCRRDLLVDVDFPGSDIIQLSSPDAEHCQLLCTQHPSCVFFSFLRPDIKGDKRYFYCYLKSTSSGEPKVRTNRVGITSGFSLKPCNPDPQPCLSRVYQDVDFPGADYRSLFTTDYEECQSVCTNDPGCQFFTFLDHGYGGRNYRFKCHLKFSWTVPKIPAISWYNALTSGFSHRVQISQNFDSVCQDKLFPNQNIPGHDITFLPAVSPEHCLSLCSAHPQCTYFSYIRVEGQLLVMIEPARESGKDRSFKRNKHPESHPSAIYCHILRCYLKNNPSAMALTGAKGIISGLPARFCQPDNSWMKKTYAGINFPASDIRFLPKSDVEECQRACNEDPYCQFYTFATKWRRCYLKRVITLPAPPRVTKLANVVSGFSLKNCNYIGT